jgi:hypothetical protein
LDAAFTRVRNVRCTVKVEAAVPLKHLFLPDAAYCHIPRNGNVHNFCHKPEPVKIYCGLNMDSYGDNSIGIRV